MIPDLVFWIGIPLLWILSGIFAFRWYNLATGREPDSEFVLMLGPFILPVLPVVALICGIGCVISRDSFAIRRGLVRIHQFMLPLEYDKGDYSDLAIALTKHEREARDLSYKADTSIERQIFKEAADRYSALARTARERARWNSHTTERVKQFKKKNNLDNLT